MRRDGPLEEAGEQRPRQREQHTQRPRMGGDTLGAVGAAGAGEQ